MPYISDEPYDHLFLGGVECPDDVHVPLWDGPAYVLNYKYRHVYDKLWLCRTQALYHGPLGTEPRDRSKYPLFVKPVINMLGLSIGAKLVPSYESFPYEPGYLWMEVLEGPHTSTDIAVVDGEPVWMGHVLGQSAGNGKFLWWERMMEYSGDLDAMLGGWIRKYLRDYTGMVNLEAIGGLIIDAHLRMSLETVTYWGGGWLEAVFELYRGNGFLFRDEKPYRCHVPLYGADDQLEVDQEALEALEQRPGVYKIVPTLDKNGRPEKGVEPNGHRRAVVIGSSMEVVKSVRDYLGAWGVIRST